MFFPWTQMLNLIHQCDIHRLLNINTMYQGIQEGKQFPCEYKGKSSCWHQHYDEDK